MTVYGREPSKDLLADILAAFDESLAAADSEPAGSIPVELNATDATHLEREKACVRLLRQVWPPRSMREAPESANALPAMIGRFELRRELGRGGFGTVFLAFDPLLERDVALKMPRPGAIASAGLRRRFLREARAAAGLNHANIVTVYEAGECGAIGFLVASYIAGPTLTQWMREQQNPVSVRLAANIVADLAEGVEHAHGRGVLHRDIKPSNVLLAPRSPAEEHGAIEGSGFAFIPKLTDFGLARLIENSGDETQTGAMLGTPRYMAPEQIDGRLDQVGPPTDVHALGTILYELLAGRPPHVGESDLRTMVAVAHDEAPPLRRWRAGIPRDLETICQHCLAKAPAARYASAGELGDDLRRFLAGKPIHARPLNVAERLIKWTLRQPAQAALVVLGLFSVCGFAVGVIAHTANLRHSRDVAERRRLEALDRERTIRRHVYAAEMQLAHQAYRNANQSQFEEILERHRPAETDEDVRGFEWHYLWRLCHCERMTLYGHEGDVYCATFSPDGRSLVTVGKDRVVRIWDVRSGTIRRELRGHGNEVGSASFSPDGSSLSTTSEDRTIRTWDVATGRQVASLRPPGGLIGYAFFLPDGKTLAAGDRDGLIRLLDAANGRLVASLRGGDLPGGLTDKKRQTGQGIVGRARILASAVSPDGKSLVAFSEDGVGQLWDLAKREVRFEFPRRSHSINGVAFAPDGQSIATAGADGKVELWSVPSGRRTTSFTAHMNQIESIAFSPDGRLLASAGRDAALRLWSLPGASPHGVLRGHTSTIWSVAFSPDGRTLATASRDGTVKFWDLNAGLARQPLEAPDSSPVLAAAVTPDAKTVVVARRNGLLEWMKMDGDLSTRATAVIAGSYANNLAISPDGSLLAAACEDGAIRLFDSATSRACGLLHGHARSVLGIAFAPDGKSLASGGDDGRCVLWDSRTRQLVRVFSGHASGVTAVVFHPQGHTLASAGRDKSIRLWDPATGKDRGLLQHGGAVESIAFSADGQLLAAAEGQILSLWRATANGGWAGPFMHAQTARRLSLSSKSGRPRLAIVGADYFLRAFDIDSPSSLTETGINSRSRATSCVAFSHDGRTLVTGDLNGSVILWDSTGLRPLKSRLVTRIGGGAVRFSRDGRVLAVGGRAGSLHLFHQRSGRLRGTIGSFRESPIAIVTLSPDGEMLAALPQETSQVLFQRGGHSIAAPWGDRQGVGAIEISPDGASVAVVFGCGGPKTRIVFWNLATDREMGQLPDQPTCDRPRVAFSPDGKLLAAGIGNVTTVWDIKARKCRATLPAHNGRIARVAFSPNGQMLATAGESDRTVRLFNVDALENPPMTFAHSASVTALAFDSDSRTMVVGGIDGQLRFFMVRTGHEVIALEAHQGGVEDLAFSPDGSVLATSGKSNEGAGELFLWYGRAASSTLAPNE